MAVAALLNDTTDWYHWGCHGTSLGLKHLLLTRFDDVRPVSILATYERPAHPVPTFDDWDHAGKFTQFLLGWSGGDAVVESDVIVINGEGTLHRDKAGVRRLLYLAYAAKTHLKKTVWIVNHTVSLFHAASYNYVRWYRRAYQAADYIAVRESGSQKAVEKLGATAELAFDCLPLWLSELEPPKLRCSDSILFSGTSDPGSDVRGIVTTMLHRFDTDIDWPMGAPAYPSIDEQNWLDAVLVDVGMVENESCVHMLNATSLEAWWEMIAEPKAAMLGRFHYLIARWCAGGAAYGYGGNTGKIYDMMNDFGLCDYYLVAPPDVLDCHTPDYCVPSLEGMCLSAMRNLPPA